MTLKRPLLMQVGGVDTPIQYSASDVRALFGTLLRNEGILQALTPGIGALKVTQRAAGANFSVDVATGAAAIQGDDVADQGMYIVQSTASENRTIPSPPGTGTRIHRVIARVKDKLHAGAWTTYEWTLEVLEDTGTGTPALPNSAISLATVSVSAGQASVLDSHITDARSTALLGPSRFTNVSTDSNRPASPIEGETLYRTDYKGWEQYNGSSWIETMRTSSWNTYTPTWTAATTNPTLGNGTLQGRYRRLGSMVIVWIWWKAGSTTTFGNGSYAFGLPPLAARTTTSLLGYFSGSALIRDNSASDHQDCGCYINSSTTLRVINDNVVSHDSPQFWQVDDEILVQIMYEVA